MGNRGGSMKDPLYHVLMFVMGILSANSIREKIFMWLGDSL
jgi:hypothetical protein